MIYKPEFAEQASHMCRLGATDEELAEHFEVCVRTIYRWRNTHEEFADAVVVGKHHADARVERALYSRAVGCSVERTKVFRNAGDEKPVCVTYQHHYPPDANAARHWLSVRQAETWAVRNEEEEEEDTELGERLREAFARIAEHENAPSAPRDAEYEQPRPVAPHEAPPEADVPPPRPGPEPERDPERDATWERATREWDGPSPIWDPKPIPQPSPWGSEDSRNRPP